MSLLKTGDGQARVPDLRSKAGTTGVHLEGKGILSQLEHGVSGPLSMPALRWRPGWRHWSAGALCLVLLITAMLADDTRSTSLPLPPTPATAMSMAAPALPPPAAAVVPASAAHAATIVNTAGPPLPALAATAASTSASAPRKAARAPGARPAAAPGDSDVALLAAMVAHAHRQEATVTPTRDVVLRKQGQAQEREQEQEQETMELLQRCKQLGLIEGMLCRSRICSGRWDSDPACH
ncbi:MULTISPECIES: hypothetical protein [unclassified Janthinobacterium]|uniref:hypothetical protein n=1 Tax=unclassified Janthinobacterium TaxID=2610881 RepID=UPI0018CA2F80|nr:hypothetical protein [Janthinobacterium sp. CG_23.4]MDH6158861.1 hypothetical protein [Janthinobacterium sp. CG_23.4]